MIPIVAAGWAGCSEKRENVQASRRREREAKESGVSKNWIGELELVGSFVCCRVMVASTHTQYAVQYAGLQSRSLLFLDLG